mmetsp:Transcript_8695/g.26165  ORF Transcript_8695/g.26165 Transcript_8695/m.26165 type:complete len:186 (-) Transcript_8695:59-616(-)
MFLRLSVLLAALAPAQAKKSTLCPASKAWIHAWAEVTATFETATCAAVRKEMNARGSGQDGWRDPHNGGTYTLKTSDAEGLAASRTTANGQYTDKMAFAFAEKDGGCVVTGCSTSQVTSIADFSTNYCNLHDLYCGSIDGCPAVSELGPYTETVRTSGGASSDKAACVKSVAELFARPRAGIATL